MIDVGFLPNGKLCYISLKSELDGWNLPFTLFKYYPYSLTKALCVLIIYSILNALVNYFLVRTISESERASEQASYRLYNLRNAALLYAKVKIYKANKEFIQTMNNNRVYNRSFSTKNINLNESNDNKTLAPSEMNRLYYDPLYIKINQSISERRVVKGVVNCWKIQIST